MTEGTPTTAGATRQSGGTRLSSEAGAGDEDRQLIYGATASPADGSAGADADHPGLPADGDLGEDTPTGGDLGGGMHTDSEAGEPGRRRPVPPGDSVASAVEDDAPLDQPRDGAPGDAGDGLDPRFQEPGESR